MNRRLGLVLLPVAIAVVVGCDKGEKPKYANVSGTVTYNGAPIDKGQITFAPEGRPPSTMDIQDGKFNRQAMIGSNKIIVSAKKRSGSAPKLTKDAETQINGYKMYMKGKGEFGGPPADYDPTMIDYIPPEWGSASTQMRVVESGSANDFKFEIKGSDKK